MSEERKLPPPEEGGDDEEVVTVPEDWDRSKQQEEAPSAGRDRRGLAAEADLDPMSLSGSYFHRVESGRVVWSGVIVGEVQAGAYLCQVDEGLEGANRVSVQVVVGLDKMLATDPGYEWRFYDTEEERTLAQAAIRASQEVS